MTHPSLVQIVLGCWMFGMFFVWVIAEALLLSRRIGNFLRGLSKPNPTYVNQTMNEMYGDVHVGERGYQSTRHATIEIDKGSGRARER